MAKTEKKISLFFCIGYDLSENHGVFMYQILALLLLLCTPITLSGATLHAFIAIDSKSDDVKEMSEIDLEKMKKAINTIAKGADFKLNRKIIKGSDLRLKAFAKWLKEISVEKDDCVFFYFSGHGIGDQSKKSRWPLMCLAKENEFMPLEVIEKSLDVKNPRLLVLICDSCNNFDKLRKKSSHRGPLVAKSSTSSIPESEGLIKLFRRTKGKIVASGSIPGSPSWAADNGGMFTTAFLIALQREAMSDAPSWKHLFRTVPRYLQGSAQVPQFKLHLNE